MKLVLKSVVAVLSVAAFLGLAVSDADAARGPKSGPVASRPANKGPVVKGPVAKSPVFSSPKYHLTHGVKFGHGYYFKGREHRHFRYRYWHHHRHCYFYYYPGLRCWYYWSGKRNAYYPVGYSGVVPPNGEVDTGNLQDLPATLPPGVAPPPASSDDADEA
jgi:hypothetical protein